MTITLVELNGLKLSTGCPILQQTIGTILVHAAMMTTSNGNFFRVTGHLCEENHRSPVISRYKGPWRGALMFSLICIWINGWVKNREAGDLRRHRIHYDVTVIFCTVPLPFTKWQDVLSWDLTDSGSREIWWNDIWYQHGRAVLKFGRRIDSNDEGTHVRCQIFHYNDVIMRASASQITSLTIVYSTVYSRRRSKKTPKLHVTGLCGGNSPVTGEFPAQRASNAENGPIWWRHHDHLSEGYILKSCQNCTLRVKISRGAPLEVQNGTQQDLNKMIDLVNLGGKKSVSSWKCGASKLDPLRSE